MYNPYDLIPMVINGENTYGRPVEFDSEITNFDTMENAFGNLVKPKKLSTTCPSCGQGLLVEVKLADPPFLDVCHTCEHCRPRQDIETDPFNNPVDSGRVEYHELDPLLHDRKSKVISSAGPIADRLDISKLAAVAKPSPSPPAASESMIDEDLVKALSGEEKPKKSRKTAKKADKSKECDPNFDDSDLAELE